MGLIDIYDAQLSTIGAILLQPQLMGEASVLLRADDFTHPACRAAWAGMTKIFRAGQEIDPVLLLDALTGHDGAREFIAAAMKAAPAVGNFRGHVDALKRESMSSRLREIGLQLSETTQLDDALDLLDKANAVSIQRHARERRSMEQMLKSFGDRHSDQRAPEWLPWPFEPLNKGIKVAGGKYLIIGGYPSDGKTAFALSCAMRQAQAHRKTIFYSFETDADTVEDRLLANIAGVDLGRIQDNSLQEDDWTAFGQSFQAAEWPFEVVNAAGMTVDDIRADALANRATVIYIDYLQLISIGRSSRNMSRFEEVSEISRQLQQFAKSTGITVVALSQMARPQADKKGNVPEPTMHNLRESGQIEQDADVIMLLYRMDQKDIRAPRRITVAKNKEGRTGRWWLDFDGSRQRFSFSGKQDRENMPTPVTNAHNTPVLGKQMSFPVITGEDDALPFN